MNLTESLELEWPGSQEAQSLPGWAVGDVRLAAWDPCSYRLIIWSKWEIELCVISVAMVVEAMCLYDGTQWCSVCGEEEGSKNRALGNPGDQLMFCGYLPSPGHPERPTSEIGFKPAKWNPSDERVDRRIWWLTVSKVADWSSRMRTDDLNQLLQFAGLQWLRVAQSQLNGHSWNLTV